MTKMIKMSLIAAVAVTGMTSAANAQNLEDAIKGVDVSGYIDYRLENKTVQGSDTKNFNVNEYAVRANLKSKVNDVVTANVSLGFDEVLTDNTNSSSISSTGAENTTSNQDANPGLTVINANFAAQLGSTTVIAGKQAIPSVFVDKIDTAKTGAGVVVVQPVTSYLTLAAAHFTNNNITNVYGLAKAATSSAAAVAATAATDTKTSEFIAMGEASGVNYALHYNMTDISGLYGGTEADHMYAKLSGTIAGISLTAKYATGSAESANGTKWADSSVAQLIASGKIGAVSLTAAYAEADKTKGSNAASTDVALDGDNDAEVHLKVWQASTQTITAKGDVMALTASMPVMTDAVTASLTYAVANDDASTSADKKHKETLAQLTYKMSKNFTVHARYSKLTTDTVGSASLDTDYSRLAIKYTF